MKRETRIIKDNLVQITLSDERWYQETQPDGSVINWPSITYITSFYPKGLEYVKWIGNKGFDEAERIKIEAGDKGTVVHKAVERLLQEKSLKLDALFNDREGNERELTGDEWWAVDCFQRWFKETQPEVLEIEQTVINRTDGYAGTLDLLVRIGDRVGVIDLKTSPNIWPSHELQVSALQRAWQDEHGEHDIDFRAILQVGYKRNKNGFKFTEVDDNYEEFLAIKKVWAKETAGAKPLQRDLPIQISL